MKLSVEVSNKISNYSALGVALVVLAHIKWYAIEDSPGWVDFGRVVHVIGRAVLPYFFVLSGYFLARRANERGWWRTAVIKRIGTLIVPFLAWTVLYFVEMLIVDVVLNLQAGRDLLANLRGVWGDIRLFFGLSPFAQPAMAPLWYVRNLFMLVLISPILVWLIDRLRLAWVALVAIAYVAIASMFDLSILAYDSGAGAFLSNCFTAEGLLFFSIGLFLARREVPAQWLRLNPTVLTFIIFVIGLMLVFLSVFPRIARTAYLMECLSMPFLSYGCWRIVPSRAWPKWMVFAAFPVYLAHPLLLDIGYGLALGFGCSTRSAPFCWGLFVFTLVGCVGLATWIRLRGGMTMKVLFGGR